MSRAGSPPRRYAAALALSILPLLLGACGGPVPGDAPLALHECHIPKLAQVAQCGTLAVPEDRTHPDGRKLGLFVVVLPANTRSPRPDPLVLLPGGPGQAASSTLGPFASELSLVRRTRDIVLFDPRGTGRSAPLDCPAFAPENKVEFEIDPGPKARQCLDQLAHRGVDLRQYTTAAAVADLEAVRQALRYPKLNLWGGSYGTRVALEYLRAHPQAVRTAILDGVAPPSMRILPDVFVTREAELNRVLDACKASAACAKTHHDPAATLAAIATDLGPAGREVEVPDPRTGRSVSMRLTFDHVVAALQQLLYLPETASLVPETLDEARAGNYGPLAAASLSLEGDLSEQLSAALLYSVTCAEDVSRIAPGEVQTLFAGMRSLHLAEKVIAVCDVWPHGEAAAGFGTPVTSDTPVLLFSGGLDPVTPPEYGARVAQTLHNSKHVVAAGYGHIVSVHACAPRLVATFIDDGGFANLSEDCIRYLGRSVRPPFFIDRLEATP